MKLEEFRISRDLSYEDLRKLINTAMLEHGFLTGANPVSMSAVGRWCKGNRSPGFDYTAGIIQGTEGEVGFEDLHGFDPELLLSKRTKDETRTNGHDGGRRSRCLQEEETNGQGTGETEEAEEGTEEERPRYSELYETYSTMSHDEFRDYLARTQRPVRDPEFCD